jgi:predicted nucleic acid-binding Zn ribbon protein
MSADVTDRERLQRRNRRTRLILAGAALLVFVIYLVQHARM